MSAPVHVIEPDEDLSGELVLSGSLRSRVEGLASELRHVERFLRAGVDPPTRVLFSGPSGTGKTLAARWLGWKLRLPVVVADVSAVVDKHIGESAKGIAACFHAAKTSKAILFLDEIDAICMRRDAAETSAGAELARATTTFFQQIDWTPPNRIVLAATNFPDELDPALRRRVPTEITFELPDRDARRRMLEQWLSRSPLCAEQLDALADRTEGLSGAELRAKAMEQARRAIMALPEPAPPRRGKLPDEVVKENVNRSQELLRLLDGTGGRT
ncbi:MAG: ATP-binding protein [Labilithrix sp.]|nr:ATP-binding protein [Labilithrix sp.]